MDKALQIGKSSAAGSFYLLIGVAVSTIIMSLGTLFLAGLLPASDVGLYGMAAIPATLIGYFRDWGVNSALTQKIASIKMSGDPSKLHDVIYSGIVFEVITGAILSAVCFAIAEPLAYLISPSNAGTLTTYISIVSISIFAGALINAASGIFVGYEKMKLNSVTQIVQAVIKTALGPVLIVLGFGVLGALYAYIFSFVFAAAISMLLVYAAVYGPLRKYKTSKRNLVQTLKPMLAYGLPLTVSTVCAGVLIQIFAVTMANFGGTEMMGNYYVSTYFVTLITFITLPVTTALFPTFSKINAQEEPELIKNVFASAAKYTMLLVVPTTLLLIAVSTPLINTLFPKEGLIHGLFTPNAAPKYPYAALFLSLSVIGNLFTLAGSTIIPTFLNGVGKTRQVMRQSLLSFIVGLPLAYLLVAYFNSIGGPSYAIIGGIIGSTIANIPNIAWGLHWSWKNYKIKANFNISVRILGSAMLAMVLSLLLINFLVLPYFVTLIAGFLTFLIVYIITAPLVGAVNYADIENLTSMTSGLALVSKALSLPLSIMRKVCLLSDKKLAEPEELALKKDLATQPNAN